MPNAETLKKIKERAAEVAKRPAKTPRLDEIEDIWDRAITDAINRANAKKED